MKMACRVFTRNQAAGNHFARTGTEPVLVQITGMGPTDTRYVNPSEAPKTPGR